MVLEVLASNQKNRLLEEAASGASGQEASNNLSLMQGEAELAVLTHEGLFISDALNEAQQQQQQQQVEVQDQNSAVGPRIQQNQTEAASSDSSCGTTEISVSREQSFMYVTAQFSASIMILIYIYVLSLLPKIYISHIVQMVALFIC